MIEKYKARVQSKAMDKGMVHVVVLFSNTAESFLETFSTNQVNSESWLDSHIQTKLRHLNALPALHDSIVIDREVEEAELFLDAKGDPMSGSKEEYKNDLATFERFVSALAKGFTTKENEEFIALKKKLTDNFKPEYLDLFA